jgi:flagellar motor protein MotB
VGETLLFDEGSVFLSDRARQDLSRLAASLRGHRYRIDVLGHAAPNEPIVEPFKDHRDLSYARAKEVANYLADPRGGRIEPERIRVSASGVYDPDRLTPDEVWNRLQNRRVEIITTQEPVPFTKE